MRVAAGEASGLVAGALDELETSWRGDDGEEAEAQGVGFQEGEEVFVGDLVMFKKDSSEFSKHYSLGKVYEICESHDNQVRNVWIRYKNLNEKSSRRAQRDVKTIFKTSKR